MEQKKISLRCSVVESNLYYFYTLVTHLKSVNTKEKNGDK